MDKLYCIYKHTNIINNKVYIGKTCQKPEQRWGHNGHNYERCTYFFNAIQKYGWQNFKHEIIQDGITKDKINDKERFYISLYDATNPDKGYNINNGGDGFDSQKSLKLWANPEYVEKVRNKNIENWENEQYKNTMKKKMKQAWKDQDKRKRRSDYAKSRWADENEKQKLIQSIKDACCKKIVCEQTGKIYQSIEEASKEIGVSSKNARRALIKHYSWGGYHWKYLNDVS